MGRLENLPDDVSGNAPESAEKVLKTITQDLRILQQDLVAQLSRDAKRLQAEKTRLQSEIEKLHEQHQALQSEHHALLSQRQLAQQQIWAKQLAQTLATHLQTLLVQQLQQPPDPYAPQAGPHLPPISSNGTSNDNAYQVLASLDATLNRTLTAVRQDLTSYQSALSQQINRMQTLEQQGEAILEALVGRLSQQLQAETAYRPVIHSPDAPLDIEDLPAVHDPLANGNRSLGVDPSLLRRPPQAASKAAKTLPVAPTVAPEPVVVGGRSRLPALRLSQFQVGLMLILLSTVALSLHNVVVGILGSPSSIFGMFPIGGYIRLNLGNSLLILWFRMIIVLPLMALLANVLYPATWNDIKHFFRSNDRRLLRSVVGSGSFLFLSQVLIYIAIGQIGPGVAVTILFMYPIVAVPLAWFLFGDRPTLLRWGVMAAILAGVFLAAFPKFASTPNISWLGVSTAAIAGVAFALYLISMQISFRKLHPVPVSVIQFFTIFFLTSLSLLLPMGPKVLPDGQMGFFTGSIILGTLTLLGYLMNNFGVRFMGAARASILASSGPVLTALLAFLITPSDRTTLQEIQWIGILIVTLGVIALSFERMVMQNRAAKQVKS